MSNQYDISREERRRLEEHAKRRAALRQEYIKQISNPHRHASGEGGIVFDSALQRFMSMKSTFYDTFKPTPKAAGWGLGLVFVPIGLFAWYLKTSKDKREKLYRTGQVSYRDRKFKFV